MVKRSDSVNIDKSTNSTISSEKQEKSKKVKEFVFKTHLGHFSFFSIVFMVVLFLDVMFLAYFVFNYYFVFEKGPIEDGSCLYDSYLEYLKGDEIIIDEKLCDGLFLDEKNLEKCGQFTNFNDYCVYLFTKKLVIYDAAICEKIEDSDLKGECLQGGSLMIDDEIGITLEEESLGEEGLVGDMDFNIEEEILDEV